MFKSRITRNGVCFALSLLISNVPSVVMAETEVSSQLIPTHQVVHNLSRTETIDAVNEYLERQDVQEELIKRGLNPDEISERLASLSEQEMKQLSSQVAEARAGGNILVTIVLVLLIIFLIKRI